MAAMINSKMLVLMMTMMVALPCSVWGQQGGPQRGTRPRDSVCFPGEGELKQLQPDTSFPPKVERFSYTLFDQVSRLQGDRSTIISPYSVWSVLSLAYFGALGNTQTELQNALGYINKTHTLSNWRGLKFYLEDSPGEATLNVANRGYFSQNLQLNKCLSSHIFDLKLVDFTKNENARLAINHDVNTTTQGRIPELITFLPPTTRFALVNAIFFKGTWEVQFDSENTRMEQFLVPPGRSSGIVKMMNRRGMIAVGNSTELRSVIVELPYKGSSISMYLLLPNDPHASLTDLISRLNARTFASATGSIPSQLQFVDLSLPKFKLTTKLEEELKTALASLGVVTLFEPGRSNLQGFVTQPPLNVDTAIHQATVEVNEEGTVAAAATAFINTRIGPQNPIRIAFNRPFVFLIVDKLTKIPLFMGKVTSATDLQDV